MLDRRRLLLAGLGAAGALAVPALGAGRAAAASLPYRFASTRLRVPDRQTWMREAGSLAVLWRLSAGSPPYTVYNPRVLVPGFYCFNAGGDGPTERLNAGEFRVAYALEVNGVRHRATFRGSPWTTRGGTGAQRGLATPFDWGVWSDVLPIQIPANSQIFHCTAVAVSDAATRFPASLRVAAPIGDRARTAPDAAALEPLLSGSAPITSAGAAPYAAYAPMFMIAQDASANPVVLIIGDSRSYFDDLLLENDEPRAPLAAPERGLDSTTGGRVATGHIGIPGSSPAKTNLAPGLTHRTAPLVALRDYYGEFPFTHILDQHGNNGDMDWASMAAHARTLRQTLPGTTYVKVTIPPRVRDTTDAYRTLSGQSPRPEDAYPAGARAALNNDILSNRDGLFDVVFDAGRYGRAGDATDAERSRFPAFPDLAGALTRPWDGVATTIHLDFAPRYGDRLNFDPADPVAGGIVRRVTPGAVAGEWTVLLQHGFVSRGARPAGASFACVPTGDGTHESPRMHMIEAAAYHDMKRRGVFGPIVATNSY
ncbi:hypothetical protein HNP84_007708 [Thermocatellispora tengchongensis]|uniref:Uncharacterized protein n=1 Tax=Thermocatellispora tengchongensis TaxID=1073253 RepID=A0A840PPL2_9ACTN|nr:hypothetical protein [Thermocatellispora tengchongensis]MBB5137955.1 hypothetical protein [Thermocatellispora tengchongensis]